uniref:CRAL-TRIO domain-containing protein n=1 Tax=Steinernema glaseri TaxID=37863 RepID=A0A1I7YQ20_9BILA
MWGTLLEQYPDLINKIVVVNCPKFMNLVWKACTPFISEGYKNKIILTGDDWREELRKHVHPSCLPVHYGGTLIGPDDDPHCRHLIDYPPSGTFPDDLPEIVENLKAFTIPAGQEVVQTYHWREGQLLEFFVKHSQEFTMIIMYSREEQAEECEWLEVYAGCERPALTKLDTWTWQAPYTGFYHVKYGNEKAWFLGISVNYRIYSIEADGSRVDAKIL